MGYAHARLDVRHTGVLPLYLDVMPPGSALRPAPPGRFSRSPEWSCTEGGRIPAPRSHIYVDGIQAAEQRREA